MARFKMYRDGKLEFRWTFYADNGEEIAVASEGYKAKADCQRSIGIVQTQSPKARTDDETGTR